MTLSVFKDWLAASRDTWRRDLAVLVLVALTTTVAACGGSPANTPKCLAKNCYAVAGFYLKGTDFAQTPHGVLVTIDVAKLGCDSNCVNEYGYIENYTLIGDNHLDNWVKSGYLTYLLTSGPTWAYFSEKDNSNYGITTVYYGKGPATDVGQEANFIVHSVVSGGQTSYYAAYQAPSSTQGYLWTPTGVDPGTFTPGAAEAGELLHGGHGESADGATYSGFFYTATDLPNGDVTPSDFPLELLGMGHPESDNPPSGVWVGFEGNPAAWFQTWCC